jgi:hypothetical protein
MTDCELVDIIRYDSGFLMIVKFRYRDTTWYAPVPCTRAQIDANLQGQKALSLGSASNSSEERDFQLSLAFILLVLTVVKGIAFTLGIVVAVVAIYSTLKSL